MDRRIKEILALWRETKKDLQEINRSIKGINKIIRENNNTIKKYGNELSFKMIEKLKKQNKIAKKAIQEAKELKENIGNFIEDLHDELAEYFVKPLASKNK